MPATPSYPQFTPGGAAVPTSTPGYPPTATYPVASPTAAPAPPPLPPTYDSGGVTHQYSAPPVSGSYGYGLPEVPVPAKAKGGVAVVVLAIATVVLTISTGVLATLFVVKAQDSSKLTRQVADKSATIADNQDKIGSLQKDLDATKRDLSDTKSQLDEVTKRESIMSACIKAIDDYGTEVSRSGRDSTAAKQKLDAADKACDEAYTYL